MNHNANELLNVATNDKTYSNLHHYFHQLHPAIQQQRIKLLLVSSTSIKIRLKQDSIEFDQPTCLVLVETLTIIPKSSPIIIVKKVTKKFIFLFMFSFEFMVLPQFISKTNSNSKESHQKQGKLSLCESSSRCIV